MFRSMQKILWNWWDIFMIKTVWQVFFKIIGICSGICDFIAIPHFILLRHIEPDLQRIKRWRWGLWWDHRSLNSTLVQLGKKVVSWYWLSSPAFLDGLMIFWITFTMLLYFQFHLFPYWIFHPMWYAQRFITRISLKSVKFSMSTCKFYLRIQMYSSNAQNFW